MNESGQKLHGDSNTQNTDKTFSVDTQSTDYLSEKNTNYIFQHNSQLNQMGPSLN
jgi:hypothetical protein